MDQLGEETEAKGGHCVTGRWPQLDRRVRSVAAVKAQASVFDQTLGHFMTGRWLGVFGPTDVAAHRGDSE